MKIIEPKVELWKQEDPITHVAKCARVCYGNAVSKGDEADKKLYDRLINHRHISMLRHQSVYAIIPRKYFDYNKTEKMLSDFYNSPYISWDKFDNNIYIATNANWLFDHESCIIAQQIHQFTVPAEEFFNTQMGWRLMRYTFHITTQISTSRELNRVSPNNIAERSTRYVNESYGAICRPHWISKEIADAWNKKELTHTNAEAAYLTSCENSFIDYKYLLNQGIKREDVRGILPLDTATEVIYTYSVDEWKHIINLRSDERAHPNCQIIANLIKKELEEFGYNVL